MLIYRALVGFLLLACGLSFAAAQQQNAPNNLFTAAGFIVKYATTPEKSAILRSLPSDKLVKRTKDGKLYYVYADAARCNCAYVGTPKRTRRTRTGEMTRTTAVAGSNRMPWKRSIATSEPPTFLQTALLPVWTVFWIRISDEAES